MTDDATADTPSQILDAAEEAFADAGYAGARVNAIAAAAGVNKAMLYYYFDSKEGLYRAVLERAFGQLTEVFAANLEQAEQADIRGFLAGYRGVLRSHPHLARLILRDVVDGAPHLREVLGPRLPLLLSTMGTALTKGQQDGTINPDINPMIAAPAMVAPFVIFAIGSPILHAATGVPLEAMTGPFDATAEAILLRGLLARQEDE